MDEDGFGVDFIDFFKSHWNQTQKLQNDTRNEFCLELLRKGENFLSLISNPIHYQFYQRKLKILRKKLHFLEYNQFETDLKFLTFPYGEKKEKEFLKEIKESYKKKMLNKWIESMKYLFLQMFSTILYHKRYMFKSDFVLNLLMYWLRIQNLLQKIEPNNLNLFYKISMKIWIYYYRNKIRVLFIFF